MKYFKLFVDFAEVTEALNDAEMGRLIRAMITYASDGSKPDLRGNERYLWGAAKSSIDQQSASYANKVDAVAKAREARSDIKGKQNVINAEQNCSQMKTSQEQEQDKTIKEILPNGSTKKSTAFHAPTVEEVRQYCEDRNNDIDPEYFVNYYENRGWYLSKGIKMRDWKRAVITWEKNGIINGTTGKRAAKQNAALKYEQKTISKSDFDALVVDLGEE